MNGTEIARGRNSYHKLFVSYNKNVHLKGKKKLLSFLNLYAEKFAFLSLVTKHSSG